jgi:hypothetical protein
VPVMAYIIFVAVGVFVASELGYFLSSLEEQPVKRSRRCRVPNEVRRRKAMRQRRMQCRIEG